MYLTAYDQIREQEFSLAEDFQGEPPQDYAEEEAQLERMRLRFPKYLKENRQLLQELKDLEVPDAAFEHHQRALEAFKHSNDMLAITRSSFESQEKLQNSELSNEEFDRLQEDLFQAAAEAARQYKVNEQLQELEHQARLKLEQQFGLTSESTAKIEKSH